MLLRVSGFAVAALCLVLQGAGQAEIPCPGDCDGDRAVGVDEIVASLSVALGQIPLTRCASADRDAGGTVTVDELLAVVEHALRGCPVPRYTEVRVRSDPGDPVGQGRTEDWGSAGSSIRAVPIVGGVSVVVEHEAERLVFRFGSPRGENLSLRSYEGAVRYAFNLSGEAGLDIQLRGRACTTLSGSFDVLELELDDRGEVVAFAANFGQRCGANSASLRGEVRYNSTLPPTGTHDPRVIFVPGDVASLSDAIALAVNGDEIRVGPGSYRERIAFAGKTIEVLAIEGPTETEIVGDPGGPVVRFDRGEGRRASLRGFTIRGGLIGVLAAGDAAPTLEDLIIAGNRVGVRVEGGATVLSASTIAGNEHHGVELVTEGAAEIRGNVIEDNGGRGIRVVDAGAPTIADNVVRGSRGGIEVIGFSGGRIEQNLVVGNEADEGGGLALFLEGGARISISANTVAGNRSPLGAALFIDGTGGRAELRDNIFASSGDESAVDCGPGPVDARFRFNLVHSDGAPPFTPNCADPTGTAGNLSAAPRFVDVSAGDYRLRPDSPAIDAASSTAPGFDREGDPRPLDGDGDGKAVADIGADEYTGD